MAAQRRTSDTAALVAVVLTAFVVSFLVDQLTDWGLVLRWLISLVCAIGVAVLVRTVAERRSR